MRFFSWEITRVTGMQVGGHRAHDEHIVACEKRLDKLEHHTDRVAVKSDDPPELQTEIARLLAQGELERRGQPEGGKDGTVQLYR